MKRVIKTALVGLGLATLLNACAYNAIDSSYLDKPYKVSHDVNSTTSTSNSGTTSSSFSHSDSSSSSGE
jgi:hypothetical protein